MRKWKRKKSSATAAAYTWSQAHGILTSSSSPVVEAVVDVVSNSSIEVQIESTAVTKQRTSNKPAHTIEFPLRIFKITKMKNKEQIYFAMFKLTSQMIQITWEEEEEAEICHKDDPTQWETRQLGNRQRFHSEGARIHDVAKSDDNDGNEMEIKMP